ncbi:hypothetical protein CJF42_15075 [Pseudoalteromonas sp. NBT06-2]|uniref:YciI family protein n=1 Tax=Pseudoalteromonas sp. NBT06-2 TaxID=2025950 RepID=UPI000BA59986|nr:YciI family protein [Pseudoalteromonas sp. NBT06-2]PAJ73585.1 hypothetical protein CJF42_15075 [Pseudoalteromonas sp. NBT06-2]
MFLVDMTFTDINKITPELTSNHKRYLEQEYQSNKLMFGGRKVPRNGGILVSQHTNKEELQLVLNSDPFIASGAVTYSITEFIPVMASKEYEKILA